MNMAEEAEKLKDIIEEGRKAIMQRDYLVEILANDFGWMDDSYMHAVTHVHNAIANLRADIAVLKYEKEQLESTCKAIMEQNIELMEEMMRLMGTSGENDL